MGSTLSDDTNHFLAHKSHKHRQHAANGRRPRIDDAPVTLLPSVPSTSAWHGQRSRAAESLNTPSLETGKSCSCTNEYEDWDIELQPSMRLAAVTSQPSEETPVKATPVRTRALSQRLLVWLRTIYLIAQWIFFSSAIILYNKYILSSLGFAFPLTLVLMHMTFVTLCANVWKRLGLATVPSISWRDIGLRFVPIAMCFGGSLAFSNLAYLYLSVAFIQIMKASSPLWVMVVSFIFGVEQPSWMLALWIAIIFGGVLTASVAQVNRRSTPPKMSRR